MVEVKKIDKTWTLFLDRDGVINVEVQGDYVLTWNGFVFMPGVKEALKILNGCFGTIVIISNQRCIAKGMLTFEELNVIHKNMVDEINLAGGRINKIYICADYENTSPNRKPNPGMAFQAKNDFRNIDFAKTIMVGNKLSDMQFGRNAGVHTVFAATTNPDTPFPHPLIDMRVNSLLEFARLIHG